ncbi:hypothetical protein CBR_g28534 [Chara braunii]|uniref:COX assembly mitochondrial protein n=1 Tax=Chara braunii TaxID=69332 RepID=A0A388JWB4_CHABU|nr:hypothetical protein CBR_g28534 [Chara braunii]|eukprot:GBG62057.1 hypothetical protein CBR_g28534 [Chara braunii]
MSQQTVQQANSAGEEDQKPAAGHVAQSTVSRRGASSDEGNKGGGGGGGGGDSSTTPRCDRLLRSLEDCRYKHRRAPSSDRSLICRHVERSAALCLISSICGPELDRVQTACGTSGTAAKVRRCQLAKNDLNYCLMSHQDSAEQSDSGS